MLALRHSDELSMFELFGFDAFSPKIAKAEASNFQCSVVASLCATFRALLRLAQIKKNYFP